MYSARFWFSALMRASAAIRARSSASRRALRLKLDTPRVLLAVPPPDRVFVNGRRRVDLAAFGRRELLPLDRDEVTLESHQSDDLFELLRLEHLPLVGSQRRPRGVATGSARSSLLRADALP
jgi:hypothetical protein